MIASSYKMATTSLGDELDPVTQFTKKYAAEGQVVTEYGEGTAIVTIFTESMPEILEGPEVYERIVHDITLPIDPLIAAGRKL